MREMKSQNIFSSDSLIQCLPFGFVLHVTNLVFVCCWLALAICRWHISLLFTAINHTLSTRPNFSYHPVAICSPATMMMIPIVIKIPRPLQHCPTVTHRSVFSVSPPLRRLNCICTAGTLCFTWIRWWHPVMSC